MKLSDDGDALTLIGLTPEESPQLWANLNPVDNPPISPVLLIHGEEDDEVPISQSENCQDNESKVLMCKKSGCPATIIQLLMSLVMTG